MTNGGGQLQVLRAVATDGTVSPLAQLYHYDVGTTDTANIYSDEALTSALAQPFISDAAGRFIFYAKGDFDFLIKDADSVTLDTIDDFHISKGESCVLSYDDAYPAANLLSKGKLFALIDASNNLRGLGVQQNTSYKAVVTFNASGNQTFSSLVSNGIPTYDVTHDDYGAVGDGVADDTDNIQDAIDVAEAAGGGRVFLPIGTYKISSTLTIDSDNVILCGEGAGSIIKTNAATGNMITLGDSTTTRSDIQIQNLALDSSVTRSSGAAIDLDKVQRVVLSGLNLINQWDGIVTSDTNLIVTIKKVNIITLAPTSGVGIYLNHGQNYFINNVVIDTAGAEPFAGMRFSDVSKVWVTDAHILNSGHGFVIDPQAGETAQNIFVKGCEVELCDNNGIFVNGATATSTIKSVHISGSLLNNNTGSGIKISGNASATVDGVFVDDTACYQNVVHGIWIDKAINTQVDSCICSGNDSGDTDTYNGIHVTAGVTLFSLTNNICGQTAEYPNVQNLGIEIAAGASDEYMIVGNSLVNNKNGFLTDGGTGTDKVISNNLGVSEFGVVLETGTVSTSDGTVTTIWSKTLVADTAYLIVADIVGVLASGVIAVGAILPVSVDDASVKDSTVNYYYESNANFDVTADLSGGAARVRVTGDAATAINWKTSVRILTVAV